MGSSKQNKNGLGSLWNPIRSSNPIQSLIWIKSSKHVVQNLNKGLRLFWSQKINKSGLPWSHWKGGKCTIKCILKCFNINKMLSCCKRFLDLNNTLCETCFFIFFIVSQTKQAQVVCAVPHVHYVHKSWKVLILIRLILSAVALKYQDKIWLLLDHKI